jgi:glycosyltransferase involved in cell wall biosynthesis
LTWIKLRLYLSQLLVAYTACTVVSHQEARLFAESFPRQKRKVAVIPNCISYEEYQQVNVVPIPNQLIFTGSFRFPVNYEAMQWFVGEVYPRILEQVPETRLVITGDHANRPLPPAPNITLAGYVDDIKSRIASSTVSIAPILSGGGTRLKILEAMAIGIPVVSTSKGAEGLTTSSENHVLVADSPDAFADCVVSILKNKTLWNQFSLDGKRFVKENFNWETVMPHFLDLVKNTAQSGASQES